jgi:hypothetical protein
MQENKQNDAVMLLYALALNVTYTTLMLTTMHFELHLHVYSYLSSLAATSLYDRLA